MPLTGIETVRVEWVKDRPPDKGAWVMHISKSSCDYLPII
jgi:hypothetical protein